MTTSLLTDCVLVVCLVITVQCRSYEVESNEEYDSSVDTFEDSVSAKRRHLEDLKVEKRQLRELEAKRREREEIEAEKHESQDFEAAKRESQDFDAVKRELEEVEIEKRFIFGCDDVWKCPKGQRKRRNSSYSAKPNGCGTEGLNVDWLLAKDCPCVIRCCNAHDDCYGRYGASRNSCDRHFADCNTRAPTADCRKRGKWLSDTVSTRLGCIGFDGAQKEASICE